MTEPDLSAKLAHATADLELDGEASQELGGLVDHYLREASARTASLVSPGEDADPDGRSATVESDRTGPPVVRRSVQLEPIVLTSRYEELGLLGRGGVGEVIRVRDRELQRAVALKVLQPSANDDEAAIARFIDEAQVTAQLEHPGIVPVHDIGRLPDGRVFFTMKHVRGRTLAEVIREVHAPPVPGATWTFRRLVDIYHRVCEAVAYAHARGAVHRDLKPNNVMVGEYGEALVLDWGLVKLVTPSAPAAGPASSPVVTTSARPDAAQVPSLAGSAAPPVRVAGTLAYMSPEQARGELSQIGPASDVYALGAVLYEILTGEPPYAVPDLRSLLRALATSGALKPSEVPRRGGAVPVPAELEAICLKAMARGASERHADANALAAEVGAWLEGARSRERALELVARADAILPEVAALRAQAAALRGEASRRLEGVRPFEPAAVKEPAWALEDDASRLELRAETQHVGYLQTLRAALSHVADLPEALARLSDSYRAAHAEAEASGDVLASARNEALLRTHGAGAHAAYLTGNGAVTVVTEPAHAEATLYRYEARGRRLVPELVRSAEPLPFRAVALPRGSYLLEIRAEGRATVRYPIAVGRQEHWDGIRPGAHAPLPVYLPHASDIAASEVYVPAGPFRSGGDAAASNALPARRLWVDAFVIQRVPVTNREYLAFLNDLVAEGREEEALRWAPRERAGRQGERGALIYGRSAAGEFFLAKDAEGNAWPPNHPVLMITWFAASAYARWFAAKTGEPWRLPCEWEWEKAARGVDGRCFPWGDFLDATWCCIQDSHAGRPLPASTESYPDDESPYGVRGLGGNVRDWCADVYCAEGAPVSPEGIVLTASSIAIPVDDGDEVHRVLRGGAWVLPARDARSASRGTSSPSFLFPVLGFRLVRSVGAAQPPNCG